MAAQIADRPDRRRSSKRWGDYDDDASFAVPNIERSVQREAKFDSDLPIGDLSALDVTAGIGHLEPSEIVNGLSRALYCNLHRVVRAQG